MRDYKFPSMTSGYQVRRSTRQEKDNIISTCFTLSQRSIIDSRHFSSFSLFGAVAVAGVMLKIIRQIFVFSKAQEECISIEQEKSLFIDLLKSFIISSRLKYSSNFHDSRIYVKLFNAALFHHMYYSSLLEFII